MCIRDRNISIWTFGCSKVKKIENIWTNKSNNRWLKASYQNNKVWAARKNLKNTRDKSELIDIVNYSVGTVNRLDRRTAQAFSHGDIAPSNKKMFPQEKANYKPMRYDTLRISECVVVCGRTEAIPVSYTHLDVYKRQEFQLCTLIYKSFRCVR